MSDLISREEAIAYAISGLTREIDGENWIRVSEVRESIKALSSPQSEIIRGKDCKHRPKRLKEGKGEGFNLEFPDYKCPCQCDDGWYNWMPDDNWFCGNGERKES